MTTAATPTATPIAAGSVATRPAAVSDVERLYPIINTAYRSDKNWTNESELVAGERITADELRAQIETQVDPILVAELDGQVIGCIQLEFCRNHASLDLPEDAALIGLLAVHSEFQSRGLGKTLFAAATAFAKSEGKCSKAMMFVINKRLDIQAWYERLGFQWTGEKRDFVFPDLTLQEDIWFKIYEKSL
ncbi:N-acetyltransferase gcn5 [Globisporangium polare]